jgi:hypothetical protein
MSTLIMNAGSTVSWMRAAWMAHLERAIIRAEGTVGPGSGVAPKSGGNRTLIIVLAVVGVLLLLCVCILFIVPILMGPAIGNVFSGITDNLQQ